ncbi:MAG: hypothetical protein KUG77_18860, partial [Nannocystaceae bacterium]|nr:hypothetical protein [Nannocystaceae bacterium]
GTGGDSGAGDDTGSESGPGGGSSDGGSAGGSAGSSTMGSSGTIGGDPGSASGVGDEGCGCRSERHGPGMPMGLAGVFLWLCLRRRSRGGLRWCRRRR